MGIEDIIGNPEELAKGLARFKRDQDYYLANEGRFIKEYPNQFIAIYGEKVITHAKLFPDLLEEIDKKGIPRGEVLWKSTYKQTFILTGAVD